VLVQCTNCGNEQTLFTSTTVPIKCKVCDALIAEPTGGRARVTGVVLRRLD
jgi:small subunit ribosomal protein S27e